MKSVIAECEKPELASLMLSLVNISAGNVVGTPASMRSFRGKLLAASIAFGPFTAFPTYNPSELHSPHVMKLGGRTYGFDELGMPNDDRPDSSTRHAIVASRPAACATFFQACMTAVRTQAYGWSLTAKRQTSSDCVFGQVRLML